MFQVNDRVTKRFSRREDVEGVVIAVNGRWITVRHDAVLDKRAIDAVPARFDYLAEELEHLNPVLRLVDEL